MARATKVPKVSKPPKATNISPIKYDLRDPKLTVLHRAGIAGLCLQIETMKVLCERASEKDRAQYDAPSYASEDGGRFLTITFTKESFHAVFRERYRATKIKVAGKKKQNRAAIDAEDTESESAEKDVPRLEYFEAFNSPEAWQNHTRRACSESYFTIPTQRKKYFKPYKVSEQVSDAEKLWEAIANSNKFGFGKFLYPNTYGNDFKGRELEDAATRVLLLNFWPLVSVFFTPKALRVDKDKKTKELEIKYDYQQPAIVVPDVINVEKFISSFKRYLKERPKPQLINGKEFIPDAYISSPYEASLAFFFNPQMAYSRAITLESKGVRGAEVYVYKKPYKNGKPDPKKQSEVIAVLSDPLNDDVREDYEILQKHVNSPPYRALRIENLLAGRVWHDGFGKLIDFFPPELFVATKKRQTGKWDYQEATRELAVDLATDIAFYTNKENRMDNDETNVPTLINEIVDNYIKWRVYNKGQSPPSKEKVNKVFEKKRSRQDLSKEEADLLESHNQAKLKAVESIFIEFRGASDQRSFAELFIASLFEAQFHTTPEQREMLRPYYEGEKWESGRWLALMAVSAAGAPPRPKTTPDASGNSDNQPDTD